MARISAADATEALRTVPPAREAATEAEGRALSGTDATVRPAGSIWRDLGDRVRRQPDGAGTDVWAGLGPRLNPAAYRPGRDPNAVSTALETRDGQRYYIVRNAARTRYLRLSEEDHAVWMRMDGTRSVQDLVCEYFAASGTLALDRVPHLVVRLREEGMLADRPVDIFAGMERALERRHWSIARAAWEIVTGERACRLPHIDALVDALHRRAAWLFFTTPMQVVYVVVSLAGGWFFLQHLASGRYDLFQAGGSFGNGLLLLAGLNILCIAVHEGAHAVTCRHYGARVNGGGAMLYYGLPTVFVDTTDVWTKPLRARLATSWAGPYSGAVLAGLAAMAVQLAPNSAVAPILHRLSFLWLLTLAFNLVPLLELDGYFMLVDWLEIPMLRAKALAFVRHDLWPRLRRGRPLRGQERLLAWFGTLSILFSVLVAASAALSWQYRLHALTQTLWRGGIWSKMLLALLFASAGLPLAVAVGRHAASVTGRAAGWIRARRRSPSPEAVRQRDTVLRRVDFLSALSAEERTAIAERLTPRVFRRGQTLYREGSEGETFYIIEGGLAEVLVGDGWRPRGYLTRGDYCGEAALLRRVPQVATIRAASMLRVFALARGDFDRLCAPHLASPSPIADRLQTLQALREFRIFAELSTRELDALASRLVRRKFAAGDVVFPGGAPGDALYLLDSGQAEVLRDEERISTLSRGAYFGELTASPDLPADSTVRALTPLDVFVLRRPDVADLVTATLLKVSAALENDPRQALARRRGVTLRLLQA